MMKKSFSITVNISQNLHPEIVLFKGDHFLSLFKTFTVLGKLLATELSFDSLDLLWWKNETNRNGGDKNWQINK